MRLPEDAVGPTDIQQYRDCPRRFAFGMRRHTKEGEHPEAQSIATAYGSAVHEAIAFAEKADADDEAAAQRAFDLYAKWLEPADLDRLRNDLATYRQRDYLGVRTVAVEQELRMPLFEYQGVTIHLRTRIDRLYQELANPGRFIHVDYKSSLWPRSQAEIDEDIQLWITNLIVNHNWPECDGLEQEYDQLNYGRLSTRKNDRQRELIRQWAIHQITAILHDDKLEAKRNQWCPWCPILEGCPIIPQLSEYAIAEIAALAPERKDGRKTVVDLDPDLYEVYVEQLEDVELARKVLTRYDETVRDALRGMPTSRRESLGYEVRGRAKTSFPPEALRAAHEVLGDDFYRVVSLTQTAVQSLGDDRAETVLGMAVHEDGTPMLKRSAT